MKKKKGKEKKKKRKRKKERKGQKARVNGCDFQAPRKHSIRKTVMTEMKINASAQNHVLGPPSMTQFVPARTNSGNLYVPRLTKMD